MFNNCTFLYVEDDKDAQEKMKLIFEDDVKEFYQAFDGREGLDVYKKYKPDMVLTDVHMPILDGLSMSKEIKRIDDNQAIIIISGLDDRETLLEAIEIGIDNFVSKPIDISVINEKLTLVAQNLQNKRLLEKDKKEEIDDLYTLAHHDSLTKAPNRLLFNIKLDEAMSRAQRKDTSFVLFFIDLDDFKVINDTYGHLGGDKVLQSVSKNIKDTIRLEDTFARISGDEFALIIEDYNASKNQDSNYIDNLANKILKSVSSPVNYKNNIINITCSIGISIFPKDSVVKHELLSLADEAMYRAKRLGKSSFSY